MGGNPLLKNSTMAASNFGRPGTDLRVAPQKGPMEGLLVVSREGLLPSVDDVVLG